MNSWKCSAARWIIQQFFALQRLALPNLDISHNLIRILNCIILDPYGVDGLLNIDQSNYIIGLWCCSGSVGEALFKNKTPHIPTAAEASP